MDRVSRRRHASERAFFDSVASQTNVTIMEPTHLERYAHPPHPHLFAKERLFQLLGNVRGRTVLVVGCGEGVECMQLAYCGALVTGIDISPESIEVARRNAALNGFDISFEEANLELDDLGTELYDTVYCNCVLHHVTPSLDFVMRQIHLCLKRGGKFLSREPVAYAAWLKRVRRMSGLKRFETPDEQPLRASDFETIEKYFPDLEKQYFRILARVDQLTDNLGLLACLAQIDNVLLKMHASRLAGDVVMFAYKS